MRNPLSRQNSPGPSGVPGDLESLKACRSLLDEHFPRLKALPGARVTRRLCGGFLDFKASAARPPGRGAGRVRDVNFSPIKCLRWRCRCYCCPGFEVSIPPPLEEHGTWAEAYYEPLESEFMEKLKGVEETRLQEAQESTFDAL